MRVSMRQALPQIAFWVISLIAVHYFSKVSKMFLKIELVTLPIFLPNIKKTIKTSCYKDVMNGSSPAEPVALKAAQKKDVETGEF